MIRGQLVKWEEDGQKMIGRIIVEPWPQGDAYFVQVEPLPRAPSCTIQTTDIVLCQRMIPGPKVVEALAEAQICGLDPCDRTYGTVVLDWLRSL